MDFIILYSILLIELIQLVLLLFSVLDRKSVKFIKLQLRVTNRNDYNLRMKTTNIRLFIHPSTSRAK